MEIRVKVSADKGSHSSLGELVVTTPADGTVETYGRIGLSGDAMFACDRFGMRPTEARLLAFALNEAAELAENQAIKNHIPPGAKT